MQRLSVVLAGAALSFGLAVTSFPAQAASPQAAPSLDRSASIEKVGDRDWDGRWSHKRRHDDDIRFGFSFGAAPFAYHPQPYAYRTVTCPYGYWYNGYGCVVYRHHPQPYYHSHRPGFSVQLGF